MNIKITQISSGCVYTGDNGGNGYAEDDKANFFGSIYSRSRVISENLLKEFPNVLQLRIRIPIIGKPCPKNLIDKLLAYPSMTNIGAMNHEEIMTMYKEIVDPDFEINIMPHAEQDELNKRRSNDVLNTDKRENLGVHMPPLEESLRRILEKYKLNS